MPDVPIKNHQVEKALREVSGGSTSDIRSANSALVAFGTTVLQRFASQGLLSVSSTGPKLGVQVFEAELRGTPLNGSQGQNASIPTVPLVPEVADVHRFDVFEDGFLVQYDIPATLV